MKELEARAIKKAYNGRLVLDLDISFQAGNIYAVLGPNGSGKSTLLRMLSLVEEPDAGEILFKNGGEVLAKSLELRRQVVLVPDRKGLFNDSVYNNAAYGLKIRRIGGSACAERVENSLRAVRLWELRRERALSLSTGEAQRLCLAMALTVNPDLVLLDEPTSSLDPQNAAIVEEIITAMKSRARLILLVTHNIFQAGRLADMVVFLYQGKLVETAPAGSFFERPQTELARSYIAGEMIY